MHFLKQPIGTFIFPSDCNSAYNSLLSKLKDIHLEIKIENRKTGEIIVYSTIEIFNLIFWKCWADKLLFEVIEIEKNKTKINVYGLPNLFKIKIKKGEGLTDIDKLLSQLMQ